MHEMILITLIDMFYENWLQIEIFPRHQMRLINVKAFEIKRATLSLSIFSVCLKFRIKIVETEKKLLDNKKLMVQITRKLFMQHLLDQNYITKDYTFNF